MEKCQKSGKKSHKIEIKWQKNGEETVGKLRGKGGKYRERSGGGDCPKLR